MGCHALCTTRTLHNSAMPGSSQPRHIYLSIRWAHSAARSDDARPRRVSLHAQGIVPSWSPQLTALTSSGGVSGGRSIYVRGLWHVCTLRGGSAPPAPHTGRAESPTVCTSPQLLGACSVCYALAPTSTLRVRQPVETRECAHTWSAQQYSHARTGSGSRTVALHILGSC